MFEEKVTAALSLLTDSEYEVLVDTNHSGFCRLLERCPACGQKHIDEIKTIFKFRNDFYYADSYITCPITGIDLKIINKK